MEPNQIEPEVQTTEPTGIGIIGDAVEADHVFTVGEGSDESSS